MGATEVNWRDSWELAWVEGVVPTQRLTRMKPFQRINHFPGMSEICKKDLLAKNMRRMKSLLPEHYNFFPLTYCLPDEFLKLTQYMQRQKHLSDVFIIKPHSSCQGYGIDLVKGGHKIHKYKNVVCQKYICKPFLFDGYKFDLRLYVLVTSVSPLRVYIFEEGLVRLATIPYQKPNNSNMRVKRMHLTNYAVNRKVEEGDTFRFQSCMKSLLDLNKYLADKGISAPDLWTAIDGIIVKTLLSALPQLRHVFHATCPAPSAVSPCFKMLGFDILLDEKLQPYLLEVNRSPSLVGSAELDRSLKTRLITNVLDMVLLTQKQINLLNNEDHLKSVRRLTNPNATRHLSARERILVEYQPRHEESRMGRFRRLYPDETGRYEDIERVICGSFNQQRN
ncbi:tubulin polyglutamylase ttll6-like [Uloborus diversus]|uniref:tubulin polyglutamylase ttll6-like n=1 Tax=Uloborus diversus TaxID=327109 RepID=UPI00240A5FCC|nr:tubulin polyglutamylase ttll6-like [Uloborus diversus]